MARQVIWSDRALDLRYRILEFWERKTGSTKYPREIETQIRKTVRRIQRFPSIGRREARWQNVHSFLILHHLRLLYRVTSDQIEILSIWDVQQDPDKLKL